MVVVGGETMAKAESLALDDGGEMNVNGESVTERSNGTVVDIGIVVVEDDGKLGGGGGGDS